MPDADPFAALEAAHTPVDSRRPDQSRVKSFGRGVLQIPGETYNDVALSLFDLGEVVGLDSTQETRDAYTIDMDPNIGSVGDTTREVGGFITSFLGAGKVLSGAKWFAKLSQSGTAGRIAAAGIQGVPADFVATDTDEARFSNLLHEFGLQNSVTEFLAYDPEGDDTHIEQRLKGALEGLGLGVALDVAVLPVLRAVRARVHAENPLGGSGLDDAVEELTSVRPGEAASEISADMLLEASERGALGKLVPDHQMADAVSKTLENMSAVKSGEKTIYEAGIEHINNAYIPPSEAIHWINVVSKAASEITTEGAENLRRFGPEGASRALAETKARAVKEAALLGEDPEGIVAYAETLFGGVDNLDVKLTTMRAYIESSGRRLDDLIDAVITEKAGATEMANFIGELTTHVEVQSLLTGAVSQVARGLRSMGTVIDGKHFEFGSLTREVVDVADELSAAKIQEILRTFGGREGVKKIAKQFAKARKARDAKGRLKAAAKVRNSPKWDAVLEYRVINMLSGPATHFVSGIGNIMALINAQLLEPAIAAGMGKLPGRTPGAERVLFGEVGARLSAVADSLQESLIGPQGLLSEIWSKKAGFKITDFIADNALDPKTRLGAEGINESRLLGNLSKQNWAQLPVFNTLLQGIDLFTNAGRAISIDLLQTSDTVFKNAAYKAEIRASVFRQARSVPAEAREEFVAKRTAELLQYAKDGNAEFLIRQGLKGDDLTRAAKDLAKTSDRALKASRDQVFQGELGHYSEKVATFLGSGTNTANAARLIIPFYRTPMNMLKFVGMRTPGLRRLSATMRETLSGANGQAAKDRANAQLVVGTMLYGTGLTMAMSGRITGRHDADRREALLAAGIPEYAVFMPSVNRFIRYNRLDPVAMHWGIMADVVSAGKKFEWTQESFEETVSALWLGIVDQTANKTWMQSVGKILQASNNPTMIPSVIGDVLRPSATLAPAAAFRAFNKVSDGHIREVRTFVDKFNQDSPGGFRHNKIRMDVLGNEAAEFRTGIDAIADLVGFKTSKPSSSPALRELARLNALNLDRDPSILGVELTRDEAQEWKKILRDDIGATDILNRLVESRQYKALSAANKHKALKTVQRRIRGVARKLMVNRNPSLRTQVKERALHNLQLLRDTEPTSDEALDARESLHQILNFSTNGFEFQRTDR